MGEKLRERSRKAVKHLVAYDEVAKYDPPPAHFPELQRVYLQQRIALVEDRTRDLTGELRAAIESMTEVEERLAQLPSLPDSVKDEIQEEGPFHRMQLIGKPSQIS